MLQRDDNYIIPFFALINRLQPSRNTPDSWRWKLTSDGRYSMCASASLVQACSTQSVDDGLETALRSAPYDGQSGKEKRPAAGGKQEMPQL